MDNINNYISEYISSVTTNRKNEVSYYTTNKSEVDSFSKCLLKTIMSIKGIQKKKGIVIICIGTDRSTGDCLGPLLGYRLKDIENDRIKVLGTLKNPVHALNINRYMEIIKQSFQDWTIIAVDASVGLPDHVGLVTILRDSIAPGAGVGKNLAKVGDISISGITTSGCSAESLMGVRLSMVMDMVEFLYSSMKPLKYIFK